MSNSNSITKTARRLAALLLLGLSCGADALATRAPSPPPVPIGPLPLMTAPEARLPVQLQKVEVRAEVAGSSAHTRIEIVFYNPNERVLEGELQFPLADGETVTGFALDLDGALRPAVPVDKAKGQQVLEDVTRTRVDPALLEKTRGNNFKLRVYPLPARGTRRVLLELDRTLPQTVGTGKGSNYARYRLPLQFAEKVDLLDVTVTDVAAPVGSSGRPPRVLLNAEPIEANGSQVRFTRRNYQGKGAFTVDFPSSAGPQIATEIRGSKIYFYAEVPSPSASPAPRKAPGTLSLVWDASGSGAGRDHGREFALLDAYFKALGSVKVELVLARDRAEAPQRFQVTRGDWRTLRAALQAVQYDGATSAQALSAGGSADLTLLFSDGLCNYGGAGLAGGRSPLFAVNASDGADLPLLRAVAERTGGRLLNLLDSTPAEAVHLLTHQHPRLAALQSDNAEDLVSTSSYPERGRVGIAGILTAPEAVIELEWQGVQGKPARQRVTVDLSVNPATSLAAGRWAALRLAQLEADYSANRAAIRRLGSSFGMVTRETSLIVLDRVEDYVRYEITPPDSLLRSYTDLLARKKGQLEEERHMHLETVAERFAQKVSWWQRSFPKGEMPSPPGRPVDAGALGSAARARETMEGLMRRHGTTSPAPAPAAMPAPRPAQAHSFGAAQNAPAAPDAAAAPGQGGIRLKKWEPNAPYLRRLRQAAPEELYRVYLDERPSYLESTAFFLDAAEIFLERGQQELGLRVISNLAEMNLENRHILRILAYRLLQAKEVKLALPILRRVLELSPKEPQSWRDLGLAYARDGQYQLAVDNLWEVVAQPWHDRFPDIELIALAELNAVLAQAPPGTRIDTSRVDERLLRNLPLDLRAVLSWDADNTDIDLWVTDPNGEKVYYGNRLGYQGGSMSRDFTGGYGPEEFSLRTAKPGVYRVQAQFYGHRQQVVSGSTTLMLRLSTGFGTAGQEDKEVILRLSGQGSEVEVGSFVIGMQPGT